MSKVYILANKSILDTNWFYGLYIDLKKYSRVEILDYSYIRGLSFFLNIAQSAKIKSFLFSFLLKKNDIIFIPTLLNLHHLDVSKIKCKVVLLCHDAIPFEPDQKKLSGINYSKELIDFWKHNLNLLKVIYTVSEYSKKRISLLLGINLEKIKVVKNGLDPEFYVQENYTIFQRDVNNNFTYVLISSSNAPRKNFKIIDEVIKKTNSKTSNIKFVRVGPRCSFFNQYDNLIELGFIDKKELISLYNFCDILLFPSKYEGFGLPILEAMHMKLSIITTDLTSIPEVCSFDGAHFVDPNSSDDIVKRIFNIIENPEYEKKRNEKNFEKSKNFIWEGKRILEFIK